MGASGVFPLSDGGVRVLEAIAAAGGSSVPATSAFVTLNHGGSSVKVSYRSITPNPSENIFLVPGDVVEVTDEDRSFFAFGATGQVGNFDFGSEEVTLNDAIARVASLQDGQADPRQVLIYRAENRATLEQMWVDLSEVSSAYDGEVPTIYRANYRSPDIFFLANQFQMRDNDVIFVTNAAAVEFQRFFNNVTTVTGQPGVVRDNVESY